MNPAVTPARLCYDIALLTSSPYPAPQYSILSKALENTAEKRNSRHLIPKGEDILKQVREDTELSKLWADYQKEFDYARIYQWEDVSDSAMRLFLKIRKEGDIK